METRHYTLQVVDHGPVTPPLRGFVLMPRGDDGNPPVAAQGWIWITEYPDRVLAGEVDTDQELAVLMPDIDQEILISEIPLSEALDNPFLLEAVRTLIGCPDLTPCDPRFCEAAAAGFVTLLGAHTGRPVQGDVSFQRGQPCITIVFGDSRAAAPRRPASTRHNVWL